LRQARRSRGAQLRVERLAPQAQLLLVGQVVLAVRERMPRQLRAQREQAWRDQADQPALPEVRSVLARRCAVREMFCFANQGC
jgi:hypothetical protein